MDGKFEKAKQTVDSKKDTDTIVAGGFPAVLKSLQQDMPLEDIRPLLRGMEEHGDEFFDSPEFFKADMKLRANALTAKALSEVWPSVSAWTKEHPDGDRWLVAKGNKVSNAFIYDPTAGFGKLRQYAGEVCEHFVDEWEAGKGSRAGHELTDLLHRGYRLETDMKAGHFLLRGFTTAGDVVWGLLNETRRQYELTSGKSITKELFLQIAPSAKQLAILASTQRLDVFVKIFSPTILGEYSKYTRRPEMKGIYFQKENGVPSLKIEESTLHEMLKLGKEIAGTTNPAESFRTGCPAIYVLGESGKHMIGEYFDWALNLTKRHYFPALESESKGTLPNKE